MTNLRRLEYERHVNLTEAFGPHAERRILEAAFAVMRAFERHGAADKVFVALRAERAFIDEVWKLLPPDVRGRVWVDRMEPISLWRDQPDPVQPPTEKYQPPSAFGDGSYLDEEDGDDG